MKIAIVALNDYSAVKGGTEVFVQHLHDTFPESRVISAPIKTNKIVEKFGVQNEYRSWKVGKEVEMDKYDLLVRNAYAGWNINTTKPTVNVFHFTYKGFSKEAACRNIQSKTISPIFEKLCMGGITIAVSRKVQRELLEYYHQESQVIENAVPDIFHEIPQDEAREHIGIRYNGPMGIFVGRADYTKGFDIVRKISKNVKVLCITSSNIKSDDNIIIKSNVEYGEMPWHYAAADFLIFPSRYESSGYAILESIKCGIPVVASRTGVLEDMRSEQVGAIINVGDEEGFVNGVKKVIKDGIVPSSEMFERFSMNRFQKEYRDLLERLVD